MTRFVLTLSAILVTGLACRSAPPSRLTLSWRSTASAAMAPRRRRASCGSTSSRAISRSGADAHRWADMIEQVNSGEMPPKKDKEVKPTQEEIAAFVTSLDSLLKEGRAARMAARPAVAHYRLSRKEYQNTVYDLLGVRYDPAKPGELNEDTLWHGFERIGSELSLSPSHVDRYYRAAELVLDRAFPRRVRRGAQSPQDRGRVALRRREGTAGGAGPVRHQAAAALAPLPRHRPERALAQLVRKDRVRSTAGSITCASRPAASARSAASRPT